MSDEIVKFTGNTLPANAEELITGLKNVATSLHGSTGGVPFLRLLKSGAYAYGPESLEPEVGSEWAINPNSLNHGWACWGDGELLEERMVPFTQPAPPKNELPDYGHEWGQQVAVTMQCLTGEDEGVSVLYKGTSTGLRNAIKELINQLVGQLSKDPKHCVPVVLLEVDSYIHKKYGQIFYPVLPIQRWISFGGASAAPADDDDGDADTTTEAPPRRRRATPIEEPATRQQSPGTARRRRRGA